ncbi:MAG: hypothetical protein AMJ42_01480 [Deltaproteobacteria bacterium DG_8]|nr:MAG: hypothetical protein AMJ42_01480 [Deltaproteobacteria bacterium DG_8]
MKAIISQINLSKKLDIFFLLLVISYTGKYLIVNNWNSHADDFAPIYVAAQLVADEKTASIYDHHPYLFHIVPSGEFRETSENIGFGGFLHPYVHLPLVSFLCRPLLFIPYRIITKLLLLINFMAVILSLYLVLKLMGRGSNLRWLSIAILAMIYFSPLRYGLWLGQTSPLIFLGITTIFYLAKAGYSKTSGFILGGIISLKITPIFFLLYFLIRKKWPLVISSIITLMVIGICSVLLVGWESNVIFFQRIIRLSGLSLASWNNQSLDGLLLRWVTDASHLYDWHLLELSFKMKVLKYLALSFMFVLWLTILLYSTGTNEKKCAHLDFSLTMILLVIFTPISWSHYLLFLVFPYMVIVITLIQNKTISYRKTMIGGLILSYLCVALPPSYFLALAKFPLRGLIDSYPGVGLPPSFLLILADFPLINKIPLSVWSSSGFFGGMLLIITILLYKTFVRKTNWRVGNKTG